MNHFLGLDLGGTNTKAGVVDQSGKVLAKLSKPTNVTEGLATSLENLALTAEEVVKQAGLKMRDIQGIGVGAPGLLDLQQGRIKIAANLPGWRDVPITESLRQRTGRPTVLENDANAAAFGEFWAGAGRDPHVRDLVMLTLGTGIGAGVVIDGAVLHGATDMAGEIGHMIIEPRGRPCPCGQRGCLEAYASASGTVKRALEALRSNGASTLRTILQKTGSINAEDVFAAAKAGDELADGVIDYTARCLGVACINLCRLLDPHMIVLAGGMMQAGEVLLDRVRISFECEYWTLTKPSVRIAAAQLGNDAGIIGAAGVAWHQWVQSQGE